MITEEIEPEKLNDDNLLPVTIEDYFKKNNHSNLIRGNYSQNSKLFIFIFFF